MTSRHRPDAGQPGLCATTFWPPAATETSTSDGADRPAPADARQAGTEPSTGSFTVTETPLGSRMWTVIQPDDSAQAPPRGLPLPGLPPPSGSPAAHYAVTAMDARGRLADRSSVAALGWQPGLSVRLSVITGGVLAVAAHDGLHAVTRQGHLRLPAPLRHLFRLASGDRLLVAAFPGSGYLIVHPVTALDQMLFGYHAAARTTL